MGADRAGVGEPSGLRPDLNRPSSPSTRYSSFRAALVRGRPCIVALRLRRPRRWGLPRASLLRWSLRLPSRRRRARASRQTVAARPRPSSPLARHQLSTRKDCSLLSRDQAFRNNSPGSSGERARTSSQCQRTLSGTPSERQYDPGPHRWILSMTPIDAILHCRPCRSDAIDVPRVDVLLEDGGRTIWTKVSFALPSPSSSSSSGSWPSSHLLRPLLADTRARAPPDRIQARGQFGDLISLPSNSALVAGADRGDSADLVSLGPLRG